MRKLVLGIIALVAVQFAFVTYTMLLKSSDRLMGDLAVSQPVPTNPELGKIDRVADSTGIVTEPKIVVSSLEPPKSKTNRHAAIVPERTAKLEASSATRTWKPAFKPGPLDTASPRDFESVVIRYNRKPSVSDCESRNEPKPNKRSYDVPKPKKRSYIAKAGPVIKKPWEWLKAIGSKLN
jgi:hypothetical protein